MDSPEQNVVSAQLPKPAALQDAPPKEAFATSTGTPIFDAKGISIYYGSFRAVTDVSLTIPPMAAGSTTVSVTRDLVAPRA